ncbi:hypothetical protein ACLKA6_001895 [Drosophila palustris]
MFGTVTNTLTKFGQSRKWVPVPQQQWSGRGRGRGRGFGWRQFGPQPACGSCACRCHTVCGKCCEGWEADPPAVAPPAAAPPAAAPPAAAQPAVVVPEAAPPGWVRIDELRAQAAIQQAQWAPLDADGNVAPAQPRPVVQWVPLHADGNLPPAQPRQ